MKRKIKQNAGKPVLAQQRGYTGLGFDPVPPKVYQKIQLGQPPTSETQYGVPNRNDAIFQQQLLQQQQLEALLSQPTVKTGRTQFPIGDKERTERNEAHASNWGMRFDPATGNVKPLFSDKFNKFSDKAGDFITNTLFAGDLALGAELLGKGAYQFAKEIYNIPEAKRALIEEAYNAANYRYNPEYKTLFRKYRSASPDLPQLSKEQIEFYNTEWLKTIQEQGDAVGVYAGRKLLKDADTFKTNVLDVSGPSTPRSLYQNMDHLVREREFRKLFYPEEKTGLISFFPNPSVESSEVEDILPYYRTDNPFYNWSNKRLNDTWKIVSQQAHAAKALYPAETEAAFGPNFKYAFPSEGFTTPNELGRMAMNPEKQQVFNNKNWAVTAPWEEVGMEFRGYMQKLGLNPAVEKDVELFRAIHRKEQESMFHENYLPMRPADLEGISRNQYGGKVKQNAGEDGTEDGTGGSDAYDFGSNVLKNYMQMRQERNQQMQEQEAQQPQAQDAPQEQPTEDTGDSDAPDNSDELAIPDATYFAKKSFEINGYDALKEELEDLRGQIATMQGENEFYQGMMMNNNTSDDDNEDTEEGGYASRSQAISSQIADKESSGNYQEFNPAGGGSGAVGKYQFRWDQWAPDITKITGVTTISQFLNNPRAQEVFYKWYEANKLMPAVQRISQYNTKGLTQEQLAKLVHFRGEEGAKQWLTGEMGDKPEGYNMSIPDYIKQDGGRVPVAESSEDKYQGLNNERLNELMIKNKGQNEYRGLDSGNPVHLYDERGVHQVLFGPDDMATLYGNVYEHR